MKLTGWGAERDQKRDMEQSENADRRARRPLRRKVVAGVVLLAALMGVSAPLAAQAPSPPQPQEQLPKGDAEITVAVEGGKKLARCTVYARHLAFQPASVEDKSLAKDLPAEERIAFTADARVGEGASAARYVGVTEAVLDAGAVTKVKITLKPAPEIDKYCRGCHPSKGEKAPRGQIIRDIHVSGKELTGKYLDKVRAQNAEVERLRKEGKPANLPILAEERIVKVGGKDVKKYFYTCESCHTLHAVTPNRKYARAPFQEKSDLCVGCHY